MALYLTQRITRLFRDYPIVSLLIILMSAGFVGFGFLEEFAFGVVMIVFGALWFLYLVFRFVVLGYNMYTGQRIASKNRVFVVIDLYSAQFLSAAMILTGLYMIDSSPNRNLYFIHIGFSAGENLYVVWLYVISVAVSTHAGTGYSSILEKHIGSAIVFSSLAYFGDISRLIIVGRIMQTVIYKQVSQKRKEKTLTRGERSLPRGKRKEPRRDERTPRRQV